MLNNKLYTAGYEMNIDLNSKRKEENYRALMDRLPQLYNSAQLLTCLCKL